MKPCAAAFETLSARVPASSTQTSCGDLPVPSATTRTIWPTLRDGLVWAFWTSVVLTSVAGYVEVTRATIPSRQSVAITRAG